MKVRPARPWLLWLAVFYVNLLSLASQVLWVRRLNLLFGSTAFVFSAVLSVFLLGLAFGARTGGQWSRQERPLVPLVVRLLVALGIFCLLSLPLFDLGRLAWGALAPESWHPLAAAIAKFVVVLLVLFPATFVIGATLPLITELHARLSQTVGTSVSVIYGLDTLGGAGGALLAGLLLVPHVGLRISTWILGSGALLVALAVHRLGGRYEHPAVATAPPKQPARRTQPAAKKQRGKQERGKQEREAAEAVTVRRPALLLAAFAVSGCAAMWLETGWNRFFYLLNGTSVSSLAYVLAGFLTGIGIGSLVVRRRVETIRHLPLAIALLQIVIAVAGVLVFRGSRFFERTYLTLFQSTTSERAFFFQIFLLIFGLVLAATLAMGANFPLVTRLLARHASDTAGGGAGAALGRAFFANTLGAVVGAFTGEFLLLPLGGFGGLLTAAVLAYLATAGVFLAAAGRELRRRQLLWAGAAAALALLISPLVLPLEPPKSAVYYHGVRDGTWELYDLANSQMSTTYQEQGYYGQVSVLAVPEAGALFLKHNGKTDATNLPGDNYAQLLMGHMPLFLHPKPDRVLNIGLGGGLTLAAILRHPEVRQVVQVEIDPLVAEAAGRYFKEANRGALEDPRVRLVIDDGRNFVDRTPQQFDVIVSEPPNIWVAGVSGLFTREFYAAARRKLAPGGILSQWFPIHEFSQDDFHTALRTLSLEFPHNAVWSNGYDAIVVASVGPLPVDRARIAARAQAPGVAEDFMGIDIAPAAIPELVEQPRFRGRETLAGRVGREINTDDLPVLEFRSAKNLYRFSKTARRDHWLAGGG